MKIILTAVGTRGEALPFVGLGAELARQGHKVCLISNPSYEPDAMSAGLELHPVQMWDQEKILEDKRIFGSDQLSYMDLAEHYYFPFLGETIDTISNALPSSGEALLVGSDETVRTVAEKYNLPWVQIVLTPGRLYSRYDPMHPDRGLPG